MRNSTNDICNLSEWNFRLAVLTPSVLMNGILDQARDRGKQIFPLNRISKGPGNNSLYSSSFQNSTAHFWVLLNLPTQAPLRPDTIPAPPCPLAWLESWEGVRTREFFGKVNVHPPYAASHLRGYPPTVDMREHGREKGLWHGMHGLSYFSGTST